MGAVPSLTFGDPGSGKSFIALDMALVILLTKIGADMPRIAVQCSISPVKDYGDSNAAKAWLYHEIRDRDAPFWFSDVSLLCRTVNFAVIMADIDATIADIGSPLLITIDTLAR